MSTAPARGRRPSRRVGLLLLGLVLPIGLLLVWESATRSGFWKPHQMPAPATVWSAAMELWDRGKLLQPIVVSAQRVLLGFFVGASLGLLAGAATGLSDRWSAFLAPTLGAIRAVPSLAWVPLLMLWLKIGEESKVTLIAIGAFFPVYTMVAGSLRHVDRGLVEAGRSFGLRGVRLFTAIQLPAVMPSTVSGLRLALAQSWLFLVAAELLGASAGLGFMMLDAGQVGRVDRMVLAIVLLAILGKTCDSILGLFERRAIRRWT